jgi:transposase-like protein
MSTNAQPTPPKRFSAQRKQEVVLRLLKGEPLEVLSRELSVPAATLSQWRETFLTSGLNGLKSKPRDDRDERIRELERKIGQITMDNELLYAKIEKMEEETPFVPRRSKR